MSFNHAAEIEELAYKQGLRVMVVENEKVVSEELVNMFKALGFKVDAYQDGMIAAAVLCREKFDLLVLNWDKNESMSGGELMNLLECSEIKMPKVIVIFDNGDYSVDTKIFINGCLFKPFTIEQAVNEVWKVIND